MNGNGDTLALFGARFEANVDFNKAIRDAHTLDGQLDRIQENVRWLGTQGVGYINAFAAAIARAAAAQGMLLNASGGFLYGPRVSVQTGLLPSGTGVIAPSSGREPLYLPPYVPIYRPPTPQPFSAHVPPTISSYGAVDPLGGFRTLSGSNLINPVISRDGTVGRVPMAGAPVIGGPSYIGGPPGGMPNTPAVGGPSPALIPHPTMFGRGQYVFTVPFTPVPSAWQRFQGGVNWFQGNVTGPASQVMGGLGRGAAFLSPQNLMRVASGIYIGQSVGNLARYATNQTIGQAMFLEERLELLENALTSPQMGIQRPLAATLADRLTSSAYFAGMPVTAAEMGLSRAELAEQFRQLAPIIRITARNQDEFQTGLQTGALARALLVARDPVQGTQGATVALSELYSGGPDRFRSLSLRFELPRNRLREIEQEMGGAGVADPGQVVIQMLREMGFGPEYLTRRAGTMSGQLERAGALWSNFRIDLFEGALNKTRDNLTALNDTFEAYLNSDAGDRLIENLDRVFGAISGFLTDEPTNLLVGAMRGQGAIAPDRLARSISEYMQARNGSWTDAAGRLTDAATSFREAADLITSKGIEQALRSPSYSPTLTTGTLFGTVGGVVGLGMLDRLLTSGAMARASRQLFTNGVGAAARTAGMGLAAGAGALLPVAAIAGAAALGTAGYQSFRGAEDWQRFAAMYPDLAADTGLDPNMSGAAMFGNLITTWARRIGRGGARASHFISSLISGREYVDPYLDDPLVSAMAEASETVEWGSIVGRLQQQAAMLALGTDDPMVVRSHLLGTLQEIVANNPNSDLAKRVAAEGVGVLGEIVGRAMSGFGMGDLTGQTLAGVVLEAAAARNVAVVSNGNTLVPDPASQLGAAGQAALWSRALDLSGGDSKAALALLAEILEHTAQTAVNTSALNPEAAFSFMRPSGHGDIFTGFITDPDMRFVRRSGYQQGGITSSIPTVTGATSGITVTLGAGAGGTQHVAPADYTRGAYNEFFRGTLGDYYGQHRDYGPHGGLDYVLGADQRGILTAPYAGRVEYLSTAEDYARYPMLDSYDPVGTFGNTAVFIDPLGGLHTYSHLSDETLARFGNLTEVRAGQQFAIQGSTGQSTGPHVHYEMWLPDGRGGYMPVNPLNAPDYFTNTIPNVERTVRGGGSVNISMDGATFNLSGTVDEMVEQATAAFESRLREELESFVRDESVNIVSTAHRTLTRQGLTR